jgi:hypothetical protein
VPLQGQRKAMGLERHTVFNLLDDRGQRARRFVSVRWKHAHAITVTSNVPTPRVVPMSGVITTLKPLAVLPVTEIMAA